MTTPTPQPLAATAAHYLLRGSIMGFAALILAMCAVTWLALHKPAPKYISVDAQGRMVEIPPTNEPYITPTDLLDWAEKTVRRTLSLSPRHYEGQLSAERANYTKEAFRALVIMLVDEKRGNLYVPMLRQRGLIAYAAPGDRAPIITHEYLDGDVYTWKLEFPINISLESSDGVYSTLKWLAKVTVQRADPREHPQAVAISATNFETWKL